MHNYTLYFDVMTSSLTLYTMRWPADVYLLRFSAKTKKHVGCVRRSNLHCVYPHCRILLNQHGVMFTDYGDPIQTCVPYYTLKMEAAATSLQSLTKLAGIVIIWLAAQMCFLHYMVCPNPANVDLAYLIQTVTLYSRYVVECVTIGGRQVSVLIKSCQLGCWYKADVSKTEVWVCLTQTVFWYYRMTFNTTSSYRYSVSYTFCTYNLFEAGLLHYWLVYTYILDMSQSSSECVLVYTYIITLPRIAKLSHKIEHSIKMECNIIYGIGILPPVMSVMFMSMLHCVWAPFKLSRIVLVHVLLLLLYY